MKKITKVIIPAAGWGTRFLPLTKVVHKELAPVLNKPIIHYLVQEAADAGIEELILVISKRKMDIARYFDINKELENTLEKKGKIELLHTVQETNKLINVKVVYQQEQLGLGHAIYTAAKAISNEPFAIILGDDLIKSKTSAIKQLMNAYEKTGSSIVGVQSIDDKNIHKYGVVKPENSKEKDQELFSIVGAVEKPDASVAPSNKAILGRYVFTPEIMKHLSSVKPGAGNEINLVDAFDGLMGEGQKIYAFEFEGTRYDLGSIEGFVKAQIDYALDNHEIKDSIRKHIDSIK